MKLEIRNVTPSMATRWLSNLHHDQRRISDGHVTLLASQMSRGLWRQTGEPIKFGIQGDVYDGQHRLAAIVKSGVSLDLVLAWDIDEIAFPVMDTGTARSAAQSTGIPRTAIAAMRSIEWLHKCEEGGARIPSAPRIANHDFSAFYQVNDRAIGIAMSMHKGDGLCRPPSLFVALAVIVRHRYGSEADEFCVAIETGEGLGAGAPALALRNWLLRRASMTSGAGRAARHKIASAYVYAFNAWIEDRPISKMSPNRFPAWTKHGLKVIRSLRVTPYPGLRA